MMVTKIKARSIDDLRSIVCRNRQDVIKCARSRTRRRRTVEIAPTRKQNLGWLDTALYQRGDEGSLQHKSVCGGGGGKALAPGAERSRLSRNDIRVRVPSSSTMAHCHLPCETCSNSSSLHHSAAS